MTEEERLTQFATSLVGALEQCRAYLRHIQYGDRMPRVERELLDHVIRPLIGEDPFADLHALIAGTLGRPKS